MFLIPNCNQKLLHIPVPQCIIIREFFCYTKVAKISACNYDAVVISK